MTKTVFDNSGVAHAFASGSIESGRSNSGNFFFEGDTLFSYGYHYPVAHLDRKNRIAYMNDKRSSVTTEVKHKNPARMALSHFTLIYLPNMGDLFDGLTGRSFCKLTKTSLSRYIQSIASTIEQLEDKRSRMRSEWRRDSNKAECESLENAARVVWKLHGRRGDCFKIANKDTEKERNERIATRLKSNLSAIEKRLSEKVRYMGDLNGILYPELQSAPYALSNHISMLENSMTSAHVSIGHEPSATICSVKKATKVMGRDWVLRAEKLRDEWNEFSRKEILPQLRIAIDHYQTKFNESTAKVRDDWVNGDTNGAMFTLPMTLRIKDGELQTSKGAQVPLSDAIKLTLAAVACRKSGKRWEKNGERHDVGIFTCDRITEKGDLIVGCHTIPWKATLDCINHFKSELPENLVSKANAAN